MPDYQKLYTALFNTLSDAIRQIELCNYGAAKEILIDAQCKAEELYLEGE